MRRPPARAAHFDLAVACIVAAAGVVELTFDYAFERTPRPGPEPWHFVVAVVVGLALAWRRSRPGTVAIVVGVLLGTEPFLVAPPNVYTGPIAAGIAMYGLVVYAGTWSDVAVPALVETTAVVVGGTQDPEDPVGTAVTAAVALALLASVGGVVRRYRHRTDAMRSERDRVAAHARDVAAAERARISRELHDVVAHGMSVVVLQAVGGRRMLAVDTKEAEAAFDVIEKVAGQCLAEMRRLLSIVHADDEEAPIAPQPRLSDLAALVDQANRNGSRVSLTVAGAARDLDPSLELSGYRIVQEALTNARRHAPGSTVRVRLGYQHDALVVDVEDDGATGPAPVRAGGGGHGHIGMRERAELFGGMFEARVTAGGGYHVHATLPVEGGRQ